MCLGMLQWLKAQNERQNHLKQENKWLAGMEKSQKMYNWSKVFQGQADEREIIETQIQIQVWHVGICMLLDKLLKFSELQFP